MLDSTGPLILEMHRIDGPDKSPMQMIGADLLAHYRRCGAERFAVEHFVCGAIASSGIIAEKISE
ncbi:hypothetical protein [Massilia sp. CCM 8734]|uniref:hypothetical protein n=1 Tax=Massilia sp. CCM 8734 TaxID=2609283 RepID=UPI0014208DB3|nr:hypothetical protein [Massilia sp. CCM 8734]NHZ94537.1 hypothetical protein [Massilia sp. CCM 8734]